MQYIRPWVVFKAQLAAELFALRAMLSFRLKCVPRIVTVSETRFLTVRLLGLEYEMPWTTKHKYIGTSLGTVFFRDGQLTDAEIHQIKQFS
jgi:hypothetical protein